ncbi:TetR/AcrR family transcriptional regulator [Spiractinospora alimapuensis]|uniref:TetR/AcrR family transcriptional regulator n=1 Tax=Spiractinospora alimapuensis TaxID=2820884 RepID=UPI001F4902A9|nr:TetR/AcrR family transcriptional regulator [Spiractinospora alimapuensis]QVQ52994.1 TetR/AcrR family transcriptional regulator [Spiractinospora alimapuensis]
MAERLTREEQRVRNRKELLAAAVRVFAERGIAGASLDEVAAEAGLTKGAVYSNFANKEELVIQVLWQQIATPENIEAERLFASSASTEELINAYGDLWVATTRGGTRDAYSRVALEFMAHALRDPVLREEYRDFVFPPVEMARHHPFAPEGSELAKLPPGLVLNLVTALSIGLGSLSLISAEHCPPELFRVALRLLAGLPIDVDAIPAPPPPTSGQHQGEASHSIPEE